MNRLVIAASLLFFASAAHADGTMPAQMMDHRAHMMETGQAVPHEGGQAAFAAIQEIVAMLEADPDTDWSKVNIEALRQHLIDMDNVTMHAQTKSEEVRNGIRFLATGSGPVTGSIRRMVFAHAATMNGVGGWTYTASRIPGGAALTVTVADPHDLVEVKALGFIGVMAKGSHHQMHHLMIATGRNPHH